MKTPKISKILHLAADKFLDYQYDDNHSCWAIQDAISYFQLRDQIEQNLEDRIFEGLSNIGLITYSHGNFSEFEKGSERQAARYNWLKFAALIAEEQGV